jgi:hypothetical protein
MLTTDQKGSIAEAAIVCAAAKLRIPVSKPLTDGCRYDLIFDLGDLCRIQCKWAVKQGQTVSVRSYSVRRTRDGFLKRQYTAGEIDAFAAYCAELDQCYYLPIECFPQRRSIQLRLAPTQNNQRTGVHWAEQFEFERLDWEALGP